MLIKKFITYEYRFASAKEKVKEIFTIQERHQNC